MELTRCAEQLDGILYGLLVLIPLLSKWESWVVGIHECAEVGEPGGEMR